MVEGIDVDVVHVEVDVAVGFPCDGVEEFHFAHFSQRAVGVIGGVFHRNPHFQYFLHAADTRGGVAHGFPGKRQRQKVVYKTVVAAIAQVLGKKADAVAGNEIFNLFQEIHPQRVLSAQGKRQTVAGDGEAFRHLVELPARRAAHPHPVFRCDFDKADGAACGVEVQEILRHRALVAQARALKCGCHIVPFEIGCSCKEGRLKARFNVVKTDCAFSDGLGLFMRPD